MVCENTIYRLGNFLTYFIICMKTEFYGWQAGIQVKKTR